MKIRGSVVSFILPHPPEDEKIKQKTGTVPNEHSIRRSHHYMLMVAPVAYQVILEHGIGQFREFEPRRVHTRINSLGFFLWTN